MPFPTNLYPRASWTGSLSVEAALPVAAAPPAFMVHKMENWSVGGVRETIVLRTEESRNVALQAVEPAETQQWQTLFYDHAARGNQFEFLLDRFTGPVLTFPNTVRDQDLAGVMSLTAVATFQTVGGARGLVSIPGSFRAITRTNVGSENHTLTHSQGTLVLTAVCSFTSAGIQRILWDVGCMSAAANGFFLCVQSGLVRWTGFTSTGNQWTLAASVNWPSGATVTFIGQWQTTKSMNLYVTVQGSATLTATFNQVGSSGIPGSFTTLANTIVLLSGVGTTAGSLNAVVQLVGHYRYAYDDPSLLASHFPLGKNFYPRCEVLNMTAFAPTRANVTTDLWDIAFSIRDAPQ